MKQLHYGTAIILVSASVGGGVWAQCKIDVPTGATACGMMPPLSPEQCSYVSTTTDEPITGAVDAPTGVVGRAGEALSWAICAQVWTIDVDNDGDCDSNARQTFVENVTIAKAKGKGCVGA